MLDIGTSIGRYKIESVLGAGGIATVYQAKHSALGSLHAVKVLGGDNQCLSSGLMREGRVQANLRHPNIVAVTDVLEHDRRPVLVLELVEGPTLAQWLATHTPTSVEALHLYRGILSAINAAHDRGVVHRDLKPANVLLAPLDRQLIPKVTDFGLVKSVFNPDDPVAGAAVGTPEYMAPEQIRDPSAVDHRADLFALGCILYELVCHRRAFRGGRRDVMKAIVAGEFDDPGVHAPGAPSEVLDCIRQLLAVDPDDRPQSVEEVVAMLYEEEAVNLISTPDTAPTRPIDIAGIGADPTHVLVREMSLPTGAPLRRVVLDREDRGGRLWLALPSLMLLLGVALGAVLLAG
jgi:eukaryotic-like serine/threonine-protein kinase